MEVISLLWSEGVTRPMTNGLVFLYTSLGSSFGLAIIAFTILTRLVLFPLTVKQLKSTKAMQLVQPRLKALQERLKNDRVKLQREQMQLFKAAGVSPLGCLGPMFLQLPIFLGMFYAIRNTLADTPEQLVSLSRALYSWLPGGDSAIPLNSHFLTVDLGRTPTEQGGPLLVLMPVLVGGSMWVVQKMITTTTADSSQQMTTNMMNWMFPLMFGFFTLNFPNGLALYWIITNVVSIALQYRVVGWGGLARQPAPVPAAASTNAIASRRPDEATPLSGSEAPPTQGFGTMLKRILLGSPQPTRPAAPDPAEEGESERTVPERPPHAGDGDDRPNRRRSYRQGSPSTRSRSRRRRGSGRR